MLLPSRMWRSSSTSSTQAAAASNSSSLSPVRSSSSLSPPPPPPSKCSMAALRWVQFDPRSPLLSGHLAFLSVWCPLGLWRLNVSVYVLRCRRLVLTSSNKAPLDASDLYLFLHWSSKGFRLDSCQKLTRRFWFVYLQVDEIRFPNLDI